MTTKPVTIRLIDVSPDLVNKRDTGAPLGWISSILSGLQARIPQLEQGSAMVFGLHDCVVRYQHTLTPEEALQDRIAALESKLAAVKALIPASGQSTVEADAIREALA